MTVEPRQPDELTITQVADLIGGDNADAINLLADGCPSRRGPDGRILVKRADVEARR